jgi:sugar phosphate isomerase/epimerase
MKIGVVLVLYGDLSLTDALDRVQQHGLEAVEFGSGNYGGTAHLDPQRVVEDTDFAETILREVQSRDLVISALSCHGNPLHPQPEIARTHDETFRWTCRAAVRLGVEVVNLFSGCPGDQTGGATPNWVTCPWPPEYSELYEWQWDQVAVPYWQDAAKYARSVGIERIGFEMHPGMIVYNPATLLRLRGAVGEAIGANFDPSHLFWQGIDAVSAIRLLGRQKAIYHVHAKDTYVDAANVQLNGNIDPNPYTNIVDRAWTFRTVGYGHGEQTWKEIVSELRLAGFDGVLSIEHEDMLLSVDEGLAKAVEMLKRCRVVEAPATPWWT